MQMGPLALHIRPVSRPVLAIRVAKAKEARVPVLATLMVKEKEARVPVLAIQRGKGKEVRVPVLAILTGKEKEAKEKVTLLAQRGLLQAVPLAHQPACQEALLHLTPLTPQPVCQQDAQQGCPQRHPLTPQPVCQHSLLLKIQQIHLLLYQLLNPQQPLQPMMVFAKSLTTATLLWGFHFHSGLQSSPPKGATAGAGIRNLRLEPIPTMGSMRCLPEPERTMLGGTPMWEVPR